MRQELKKKVRFEYVTPEYDFCEAIEKRKVSENEAAATTKNAMIQKILKGEKKFEESELIIREVVYDTEEKDREKQEVG